MSETKERSGLFKFFYVLLSIITFPIFAVLFILRHPLWVLFILLLLAGGAVYWPMSQHNVQLAEVVDWYKQKYQTTKIDLAKKAMAEGNSSYVPKAVLEEMRKIEEDAEEAKLPKGENYNAKVARDKKSEDMKANLKKRGGFKKKSDEQNVVSAEVGATEENNEAPEIKAMMPQVGGLSALIPSVSVSQDNAEEEHAAPVEVIPESSWDDKGSESEIDLGLGDEEKPAVVENLPAENPISVETKADDAADDEDEMDLF